MQLPETINDQIRRRLNADMDLFSDAFVNLSEAVTGTQLFDLFSARKLESSTKALTAVLEYYGIRKTIDIPNSLTDPEERLNYVIQPEGIMRRAVALKDGWYRNAFGALIGTLDDGATVALIPGLRGYCWVNSATGEKVRITATNAGRVCENAICFYPPLPSGRLTVRDLLHHVLRSLALADFLRIGLCTLAVTLVSMITPRVTEYIYRDLILQPRMQPLFATFLLLLCAAFSQYLLNAAKSVSLSAVNTKTDASVSSAIMMRVLNLPASFFREIPAGELYSRINCASTLCSSILDGILSTGLTVIMSLIYFSQIFRFSPALVLPSLVIVLSLFAYSLIVVFVQASVTRKKLEAGAQESGFLFSMLSGIQKIKQTGSERRIFSQWADIYKKSAELTYSPPFIVKYNAAITTAINLLGAGLLYFFANRNGVSPAAYMAFVSAYALLSGSFSSLSSAAMKFSIVPPILKLIRPVLEATPEISRAQRTVTSLSGRIDISGVSFRYRETMPMVINELSLHIAPGDYVAIVGKSGCGKSTLLRMLLGLERPLNGSISYDNMDITTIDPKSLRSHIGCVMQNAALLTGTLRDNITVAAPQATEEDVWRACRMAGIESEIRRMPMGLDTLVSDSTGGISGGQKQRILIARAIVSNPNILFFDEATSALDNNTQKLVADALASLHCTRVVIAHRLSTVQNCDRILMLEKGKIIEDGTYEELIALNGEFAKLVSRQQAAPAQTHSAVCPTGEVRLQ